MQDIKIKFCIKCKIEKSFDQFHKGKNEYGLQHWCKDCMKNYQFERKDEIKVYQNKYRNSHI